MQVALVALTGVSVRCLDGSIGSRMPDAISILTRGLLGDAGNTFAGCAALTT
jgi:hypothetical protein